MNFKSLNPKEMTKEDMIKKVTEYVEGQSYLFDTVCGDIEEYTLSDWLYEHSEVDIKSLDNIKNLTDEEFEKFFDNILFEE